MSCVSFNNRFVLEALKRSFRFWDAFPPRLYDAYGRLIQNMPTIPKQIGGTIEFRKGEK